MNTHTCYFLLFFKINMLYANNKQQIHSFIFIISLLMGIIFSWDYKDISAKETDKVETWTWLQSFTWNATLSWAKRDWRQAISKEKSWALLYESNAQCDKECKIDKLIEVGIIPEIAESLVTNCKALADDPRKCVLVWASIVTAESSWWKNCRKNNQYNCFGIMQSNNYKSYSDATLHFAWKFQKWWRNAKSMEFFYPKRWETSPSRYCVSEHSSNSSKWCENWLKNSSAVFNKLNKLF